MCVTLCLIGIILWVSQLSVAPTENVHEESYEAGSKFIDSSRGFNEFPTVSGTPDTAKLASESTKVASITCSNSELFASVGAAGQLFKIPANSS